MANHYSPRLNKSRKKNKGMGRRRGRGIGARGVGQTNNERGAYDLCAPAWAAIIVGGLAAYGTMKAFQR
jgi:hypothetical protein